MPFVTQEHRHKPNLSIPGDRCFVWYQWMIGAWRKERRWTTADKIYRYVLEKNQDKKTPLDQLTALNLAWQVFFVKEVMIYEEEKMEENGDI